MSCIENGHSFEIIRQLRLRNYPDRVKEEYECRECGTEYSDFVDIKDVNKDDIVSLCESCDEEIEYDKTLCEICEDEN